MKRFAALAIGGLILTLAIAATSAAITSGAVLDQSTPSAGCQSFIGGGVEKAQTFTAGLSGFLTDVVLELGQTGASAPLHVAITAVSGGGAPTGPDLAAVDVPMSSVGGSAAAFDVTFSSPTTVVAGTTYAIVLSSGTGGLNWAWNCNSSDSYAGGEFWLNTGSWSGIGSLDHQFATYVLAPVAGQGGRAGYCAAPGDTRRDGSAIPPGTFLDLVAGQPATDPHYAGATPAVYGEGYGITCDNLAGLGYTDSGHTVEGLYEYFTK